jgi:hypothetical protein
LDSISSDSMLIELGGSDVYLEHKGEQTVIAHVDAIGTMLQSRKAAGSRPDHVNECFQFT